jgi:hypothetical protein
MSGPRGAKRQALIVLPVSVEAHVGVPTLCRSQNALAHAREGRMSGPRGAKRQALIVLPVSVEAHVGVPTLCRSQNVQLMLGRAA